MIRPYVTLSCAISLDGYLDTAEPPRLVLSNAEDFDRVDAVRARHDAILVGAQTVRLDNPRLLVRSAARREERAATGACPTPWKATVTATGDLDPAAAFFTHGDTQKLVYCPSDVEHGIRRRLGSAATVVPLGRDVRMRDLLADLGGRGVARLMVEGGGRILRQFLGEGLADELHLVVAPLFVGDARAPRFTADGRFPWVHERRAALIDAAPIGDVVLLRYALSDRFDAEAAGAPRRLATSSDGRGRGGTR